MNVKQGMTKILERFSKPIQFCSHIFFHIRGNVAEDRDYFSPFFPRCKTAFLSFGVMNILGGIIVWCGGCLVEHCRLFSSSPGLYSLDARSTLSCESQKCFQTLPDVLCGSDVSHFELLEPTIVSSFNTYAYHLKIVLPL